MDPTLPSNITTVNALSIDLLQCSKISTEITFGLVTFYSVCAFLGLLFNILLLWTIWPQLKNNEGIPTYVVNLVCAALLESVTLPVGVAFLLYKIQPTTPICFFVQVLPTISQRIGATFVVLLFIVRYVAVTHPLRFRKLCSHLVCGLSSIFLWLVIISISVAEWMITPNQTSLCFPEYRVAPEMALFELCFSLLFGLFPLIILISFWHLISKALRNSPSVPNGQRRRINILLLLVVAFFGTLYGPLTGIKVHLNILLLLNYHQCQVAMDFILVYQLTFALNSLCVILAPVFYFFSSSDVKERVLGLFRKSEGSRSPM